MSAFRWWPISSSPWRDCCPYRRHIAKFQKSFPRFDPVAAPVYAMVSLNGFDGHLQEWNGKVPLFFGLDGIVHFHGDNPDLSVLLDHESFRLVQVQEQPDLIALDPAPLWTQLWREGSATFVSAALNPKATRERVLLDSRDLATAPPSAIARLAGQFLQHFDSTDRDLVRKYFSARYRGSDPARSGYLVGLEACRVVARNMTLTRFATLSVADTHQRMRDALEQLAVAPPCRVASALRPKVAIQGRRGAARKRTCVRLGASGRFRPTSGRSAPLLVRRKAAA